MGDRPSSLLHFNSALFQLLLAHGLTTPPICPTSEMSKMDSLPQPATAEVTIPLDKGDTAVTVSLADLEALGHNSNATLISVDSLQRKLLLDYLFETSSNYDRGRIVPLEVQCSLLDNQNHPYKFRYMCGTAFAIDTYHLITALHVVTPDPKWDEEEDHTDNAVWRVTLIKARDLSFKLPRGVAPHEFDRWSMGGSDYTVKFSDKELDLAVLHSQFSHLSLPISLKPLGYGKHVYSVDITNAFVTKVFDGRCWLSDESDGIYYDIDAFANYGFSGGPVVSASQHPLAKVIFLDRHAGLVGVLISDAGKSARNIRNVSRFVSMGAVLGNLSKYYPTWFHDIVITRSVYDHVDREPAPWDEDDTDAKQHSTLLHFHHTKPESSDSGSPRKAKTSSKNMREPPQVKNWRCPVYVSGLPFVDRE